RARIGALEVTKTLEFQPDLYSVRAKLSVSGRDQRFVGLSTALVDRVEGNGKGGFFSPSYEQQEFFVEEADAEDRVTLGQEEIRKSWSKVQLASLGSQYFTQAVVDHSPIMPEAKGVLNPKEKSAEILLQYPALNQSENFQLDFTAFLGPKSYYLLKQVNEELPKVVDFGFFNWIGRHILSMLQWFHSLVGNWGVAIILLTILVRFLVLPFNLYSYKSMRAMQMIQPQIQALRERHKDDQQKQQQEMLQLMRENRVNPVGGCLPVLLQFPIFIALYQVLGHSIELYQAPFMLWINDLSLKDPYYILPVLMGLTMFIQQKITPHTMDPAQAKVMLMMPLIFTFFMVSLPSGLTLYMLVGAIFSVLQQLYFMKDSKPTLAGAK
ncbi:MAG: membrane protein insertase YidC, partial [Bdellovibrionales bacterium]